MNPKFFKVQSEKLREAFVAFEKATSRNIRAMQPKECLRELSTLPVCRSMIIDLLAAQELGADEQISGIFAAVNLQSYSRF